MSQPALEELWTLAQGHNGDDPLLVRFRERHPSDAERAENSLLTIISWAFEGVSGIAPNGGTRGRMEVFEIALFDSMNALGWAMPAAVLTENYVRQWRLYAHDIEAVQKGLDAALAGHAPYPLEFASFDDPDWEAYFELAGEA